MSATTFFHPVIPTARMATASIVILCGLFAPQASHASAAPPTGTGTGVDAASSGSTDIGGDGEFATAAEIPSDENDTEDAIQLELSAGGMVATGNSRSIAITGSGEFRLRRGVHQFTSILLGNYGAGAPAEEDDDGPKYEQNAGNVQARLRYDAFFAKRWSAFVMGTLRRDPFQGLDLRFNLDPGVAFHVLTAPNHRLWFEVGYDFRIDVRTRDACQAEILGGEDGMVDMPLPEDVAAAKRACRNVDDRQHLDHAARLYAGYAYRIWEPVTLDAGIEYTFSVVDIKKQQRVVFGAGMTAQLPKNLAFSVSFQLRYDNDPPGEAEKTDTVTAFSIVYKI